MPICCSHYLPSSTTMAGNVEGNVEVTCNEQNTGWDLTSFEFEVDRIVGVRRTADDDVEYAVQWSSVTIRIGQADGYLVHSKVNGVPLVDFVQEYIQTDQGHLQVVWLLTWEPSTVLEEHERNVELHSWGD
ncbi:uncharacterized protein MYCFIDRAFT_207462 [Pseudocercospora fijiensis CIRAD86]|uniref:Uncharacterized protein n=1 Tax=Pseudocercospora fijiensis (strain CIRAD86) TaxID=383855 RepID=M3B6P5_PSEFD|nr:uncharacterized protein MYCFIDRAFT_207462 [Pseudocercospora fijiensis CIRAD86]EME85013.1 hypothetical protein MYCFIDRAFT_207462 [Pseudocercospora fijiensis CIRAD86]